VRRSEVIIVKSDLLHSGVHDFLTEFPCRRMLDDMG
jgi:hypothetical protein